MRPRCRISLEPYGGAPEVLMDIFGKMLAGARAGNVVLIPYAWFCKGIEKLGIIKRVSRSTARDLPMGYCVVAQRNR